MGDVMEKNPAKALLQTARKRLLLQTALKGLERSQGCSFKVIVELLNYSRGIYKLQSEKDTNGKEFWIQEVDGILKKYKYRLGCNKKGVLKLKACFKTKSQDGEWSPYLLIATNRNG